MQAAPDLLMPELFDSVEKILARIGDAGLSLEELVDLLASHSVGVQKDINPTMEPGLIWPGDGQHMGEVRPPNSGLRPREAAPKDGIRRRTQSPSFLHNSVRHLFFSTDTSIWELIQECLLGCTRIISLFILGPWKPEFLLVLEKLRPQTLYLSVPLSTSEWAQSTLNQSLFLSITHLELLRGDDYDNGTTWEDWAQLATLPSLTHLCLSEPLARDILSPSVIACPRLVVAIGSFGDSDQTNAREFAQGLTISDPRLVIMAILINKEDWEIGAQGGDDFWSRAEGFVARKRRGEIEREYHATHSHTSRSRLKAPKESQMSDASLCSLITSTHKALKSGGKQAGLGWAATGLAPGSCLMPDFSAHKVEPLLYRVLLVTGLNPPSLPAIRSKPPAFCTIPGYIFRCRPLPTGPELPLVLNGPLLSSVTHLELFMDTGEDPRWEPGRATRPRLLLLRTSVSRKSWPWTSCDRHLPKLMVEVSAFWVSVNTNHIRDFVMGLADPRFAQGGDGFRARAEAFVARKRKDEIEGGILPFKPPPKYANSVASGSWYFPDESAISPTLDDAFVLSGRRNCKRRTLFYGTIAFTHPLVLLLK
ncbi:hypothetical protein B0H14DRAFT_2594455 [Mycena olivaceomarginata]|nr:hypothetical protein B0H14DRAFT_2594455 [Mycena olivaceomarginata]